MLAVLLAFVYSETAVAWNGITHYHINRSVGIEPVHPFGINGTGPDMSIEWVGKSPLIPDENGDKQNWSDYFHAPNPKVEKNMRPIADKPNFGYLMLKVSEQNGHVPEEERARALGWGGHIAADWVAHSDTLFPICPTGSRGEKKHFIGECLYELYSYITKGPIGMPSSVSLAFDDSQIYKALYNYRLISIHENFVSTQKQVSDGDLKDKASATTLPKAYIRQRIYKWTAKLTLAQFAYARSPVALNPVKRQQFLMQMFKKEAGSNLSLSEMSVYSWTNLLTPRGGIPDYSSQVVPYYSKPLMAVPAGLSLSGTSFKAAALDPGEDWVGAQVNSISADEEDSIIWDEVLDVACAQGLIGIEDTETPEGLYSVSVTVADEEGLAAAINDIVVRSAGAGATEEPAALFWKRLLIDGETDPDRLADLTPPGITALAPCPDSYIGSATPEISAHVEDDPFGTGVDAGDIVLTVDGVPLDVHYDEGRLSSRPPSALAEGAHRAEMTARDRAGNERRSAWIFTVDTVGPKLCYKTKNRIISSSKPAAEVLVLPDEPVSYRMKIHPVIGGYPDYSVVIYESPVAVVSTEQRSFTWGAMDGSGNRVMPGNYVMRIEAIDRAGNSRVLRIDVKVEASI